MSTIEETKAVVMERLRKLISETSVNDWHVSIYHKQVLLDPFLICVYGEHSEILIGQHIISTDERESIHKFATDLIVETQRRHAEAKDREWCDRVNKELSKLDEPPRTPEPEPVKKKWWALW